MLSLKPRYLIIQDTLKSSAITEEDDPLHLLTDSMLASMPTGLDSSHCSVEPSLF